MALCLGETPFEVPACSKSVCFSREPVCEIRGNFACFSLVDPMFCDQTCEKRTIYPARHIMPCRYRKKRPGVVIETDRVVEARGFRCIFAKPHHPVGTVVEPPRRTQPETGIVAGKRSQFAAV